MIDLENAGGMADALVDVGLVAAGNLETESHVLVDIHVRVQRVALEHHGDAALGRRQVIDYFAADGQLAAADVFQTAQHAQQRRFATAGRADQDAEFTVVDVQIEAAEDILLAVV
eukprot:gene33670-43222_t